MCLQLGGGLGLDRHLVGLGALVPTVRGTQANSRLLLSVGRQHADRRGALLCAFFLLLSSIWTFLGVTFIKESASDRSGGHLSSHLSSHLYFLIYLLLSVRDPCVLQQLKLRVVCVCVYECVSACLNVFWSKYKWHESFFCHRRQQKVWLISQLAELRS